MRTLGHKRSALECRTKPKALRKDYKKVVGHNQKSGVSQITCPFFEQLNRIMWKDCSARPRQIKPSLKARYVKLPMIREAEPALRSEEMFTPDSDLLTINHEDLRTFTPIDHQWRCTEGGRPMEEKVLEEQDPDLATAAPQDKDMLRKCSKCSVPLSALQCSQERMCMAADDGFIITS
ncbi:UNVERIFIED_CONTAM: hypothetical protein K2H54_048705 [Gekko kuhli]